MSAIVPIPRTPITIRPATIGDYPFIDRLQDMHSKALGFMPRAQLEGKIAAGNVLIAEEATERRSDEATEGNAEEATERRSDEATEGNAEEATERRSDGGKCGRGDGFVFPFVASSLNRFVASSGLRHVAGSVLQAR
jgi:hypothetical protein